MADATVTKGRRGSGEGSVYKSPDGCWRAVIDLGWDEGRRQRKYLSGKTQSEVLAKMREARKATDAGVVTDDRITVAQLLTRWQAVNLPGAVSGSTLDDYSDMIRLHLEPALGHKRLTKLTVVEVDKLWAAKREAGLSPNTIRIMRSILRRALGQAEKEGLVIRNVAALSAPPRLAQVEGRSLTVKQARRLLDAASGDRFEACYLLMLSYGLRRGGALGLAWADLSAGARTLATDTSASR